MKSDTATKLGLRVYQDGDGAIWIGTDGSRKVIYCGTKLTSFFARPEVRNAHSLFVLGFRSNAELICELGRANLAGLAPPCYVGTPAVSRTSKDPTAVMTAMRQLGNFVHREECLAASLGGWHRVGPTDVAQYQLVTCVSAAAGSYTPAMDEALRKHPAFPAISFIPSCDYTYCAQLLALIVDPRWFVDVNHPDRLSSLRRFLGLRENNIRTLQMTDPPKSSRGRYFQRAKTVLMSWSGRRDGLIDIDRPDNFLMRCLKDEPGQVRSVQKTCSLFVSFLHDVWIDAAAAIPGQYFAPNYFFALPAESAAYQQHVKQLSVNK